jgi:hypothetical protein
VNEPKVRKVQYRLHVPAQHLDVPVYEGETEGEALTRAAQTITAFRERVARQKAEAAAGHPNAVAAEQFYAEIGYVPPSARRTRQRVGERGKKGTPNGRLLVRLPISLHEELAAQAKKDDTTINQLVLSYVSRGLGVDTGR